MAVQGVPTVATSAGRYDDNLPGPWSCRRDLDDRDPPVQSHTVRAADECGPARSRSRTCPAGTLAPMSRDLACHSPSSSSGTRTKRVRRELVPFKPRPTANIATYEASTRSAPREDREKQRALRGRPDDRDPSRATWLASHDRVRDGEGIDSSEPRRRSRAAHRRVDRRRRRSQPSPSSPRRRAVRRDRPGASSRCGPAGQRAELGGIQAGDVSESEQRPVIGRQVRHRPNQVDAGDPDGRVRAAFAGCCGLISVTGTRRCRRTIWRASLTAIARSHARTRDGSRTERSLPHAISHADWTASWARDAIPGDDVRDFGHVRVVRRPPDRAKATSSPLGRQLDVRPTDRCARCDPAHDYQMLALVKALHALASLRVGPTAQPRHVEGDDGCRSDRCARSVRSVDLLEPDPTYGATRCQDPQPSETHGGVSVGPPFGSRSETVPPDESLVMILVSSGDHS